MTIIQSGDNKRVKELVRLKKASERRAQGLIIIDGAREIELAVKAGLKIRELFYCPSLIKKKNGLAGNLFGLDSEKITEVAERAFNKICYKEKPDGFLALGETPDLNLTNLKLSKNPLIIILEAVEKPGNLGAIIRTAYAAGVEAVIINDNQTDIYNPNVIRASEGFIFVESVTVADFKTTSAWLKKNKIKSLAAATNATKDYTKVNLKGGAAIVLGSEANGLSDKWLKTVDALIKIPMQSGIDSLNVSVATAIITFEALRQRNSK